MFQKVSIKCTKPAKRTVMRSGGVFNVETTNVGDDKFDEIRTNNVDIA